jgi:hypothetical protein
MSETDLLDVAVDRFRSIKLTSVIQATQIFMTATGT